jgi:hypothetical protein
MKFFFHIVLTFNIEEAGLTETSAKEPTDTRVTDSGEGSALSCKYVDLRIMLQLLPSFNTVVNFVQLGKSCCTYVTLG